MTTENIPNLLDEDALAAIVKRQLNAALEEKGLGEDGFKALAHSDDLERKVTIARNIWANGGFLRPTDRALFKSSTEAWQSRMTYEGMCDALATPDITMLMPRVVSQIVREAVEPQLTLTGLFRQIRHSAGTSITFPAVSAMAGVADLGEASEYPELIGPRFAGTVTVKMGKVGGSVRITEEVLRYSQWDVMTMLIQGAGRAMARHKEIKVSNQIADNAVISFNNNSEVGNSDNGHTTGRDINGLKNHTLRLDDLFQVYADLVNDGFIANTLLMNPMGWLIFARDPTLRAFGFANGGPLMRTAQGSQGIDPSWDPNLGKRSSKTQLSYSSTQYVDVPSLFPVPLAIVVSPFINFNSTENETDLYMCDREEMGLMVVDEDIVTDQFDDPKRDIKMVKFRERYGLCILNEGAGVRAIKGVSTRRGYDFEDSKVVYDVATRVLGS